MEDKRVNIKTAKLAKKKGFNRRVTMFYDTSLYTGEKLIWDNEERLNYNSKDSGVYLDSICYSLPTQTTLRRWLVEKHSLNIEVRMYPDKTFTFKVYDLTMHRIKTEDKVLFYKSYEAALEKGLYGTLKLI